MPVTVMPSVMIWNMPVQRNSVVDQAAIYPTLNILGYLVLIVRPDNEPALRAFRDAVAKELKERIGVRTIAQTSPKYDSASAVQNAIEHVKEATIKFSWDKSMSHWRGMYVCWTYQIPNNQGRGWTHSFTRWISAQIPPETHSDSAGTESLSLSSGRNQAEFAAHRHCLRHCSSWGSTTGPGRWSLYHRIVCRTVKRRPREDAADPFFNSIRPWNLMTEDETIRQPREPKLVIAVSADPDQCRITPGPRRVYIRHSVELAPHGYPAGCHEYHSWLPA